MTKFPCDYCGGRELDLSIPNEWGEFVQVQVQYEYPELKELGFKLCPWCLKKALDKALGDKGNDKSEK